MDTLTSMAHARRLTIPAEHQHRSPKMRQICRFLLNVKEATRKEIMQAVNPHLKHTSNGCYFRQMQTDQYVDACGKSYHDEARYSVILNGLVKIAGKRSTGELTYSLTPEGYDFVLAL